jgi:hypothetical protein
MPACQSAAIADALVVALNAEFAGEFTAARKWRPSYKLEELSTLKVSVSPRSRASSLLARGSDQHVHTIDVTFQKQVAGATDAAQEAAIDTLTGLVERVADFMARLSLSPGGRPFERAVAIDPVCAVNDVEEELLFTSVVTAAYREARAAA